jgi:hypothetical protein
VDCFYAAVKALGVEVRDGYFSGEMREKLPSFTQLRCKWGRYRLCQVI